MAKAWRKRTERHSIENGKRLGKRFKIEEGREGDREGDREGGREGGRDGRPGTEVVAGNFRQAPYEVSLPLVGGEEAEHDVGKEEGVDEDHAEVPLDGSGSGGLEGGAERDLEAAVDEEEEDDEVPVDLAPAGVERDHVTQAEGGRLHGLEHA
jgi:hypothetical protein